MSHKDYKAVIKPFLSEKRYRHSLAVAEEAVHLAKKYGADEEKAYTAGILHDIMKDMPPEEQLKRMTRYDIVLTEVERSGQKLWHAMLGAAYVGQELHIDRIDLEVGEVAVTGCITALIYDESRVKGGFLARLLR